MLKSLVSDNVSSFRDRERGRRSTTLLPELEDVNKSRSNQQRNAYNSTYQTRHKQCAANVISAGGGGARAVVVAAIPPLLRQAGVHRLGKRDLGGGPGVSFEERLHLRRGCLGSARVLVLQAVLRRTEVPRIGASGEENDGGEGGNERVNRHFLEWIYRGLRFVVDFYL